MGSTVAKREKKKITTNSDLKRGHQVEGREGGHLHRTPISPRSPKIWKVKVPFFKKRIPAGKDSEK